MDNRWKAGKKFILVPNHQARSSNSELTFAACVVVPLNSRGGHPVPYIPLTNRVRGPYCKLRTEYFPPSSAKHAGHKGKEKNARISVPYGPRR